MNWLLRFYRRVVNYFTDRRGARPRIKEDQAHGLSYGGTGTGSHGKEDGTPQPDGQQTKEKEQEESAPPPTGEAREHANRHARRYYERQRRKFDKFVIPQGPKPAAKAMPPRPPKPAAAPRPPQTIDVTECGDDRIVVDIHYSDRKTRVLYEENEILGQFNFRDSILEQLPRYFFYLDRMKKHDGESYDFYRQVGGMLLPYVAVPDIWRWHHQKKSKIDEKKDYGKRARLSDWFLQTRPTFGCICYGASPEAERCEIEEDAARRLEKKKIGIMIPRFIYFTKYAPKGAPWELQPITRAGDIYKMTVWFDKDTNHTNTGRKNKWGVPNDFGIFVPKDSDGHVQVLKQIETHWVKIHGKNWYKDGEFSIPKRAWYIPNDYEEWAKLHGVNASKFLSKLFIDSVTRCEDAAYSMARVSVEKDGQFAMFGVDIHRLPYFFKDRDYELTESGLRKPILHLVRPHEHNGSVTKMHFRGAREFTWDGYNVRITIPGKDHTFWDEFNAGMLDERRVHKKHNLTSAPQMARQIRENMNSW